MSYSTNPEPEQLICPCCNGSGEGMCEGSRCRSCGGSGVEYRYADDTPAYLEPDWDYIRKSRIEDELIERTAK